MPLACGRAQTIDEDVVLPEHLHQRMLDELPGRARREQRFALLPPGVSYGISATSGLEVALLGVSQKIGAHKITGAKPSDAEVAGLRALRVARVTTPP